MRISRAAVSLIKRTGGACRPLRHDRHTATIANSQSTTTCGTGRPTRSRLGQALRQRKPLSDLQPKFTCKPGDKRGADVQALFELARGKPDDP